MRPIDLQQRLLADHRRLEKLFTQLMEAFNADAREDTQQLWSELERGLETHFTAEERFIFPSFGEVDAKETRELAAEHTALRSRLADLGVGVDLKCVRADVAKDFIDGIRRHAAREDALLYRWASTSLPEASAARLFQSLPLLPKERDPFRPPEQPRA